MSTKARVHVDGAQKVWVRGEGDARCVGSVSAFLESSEYRFSQNLYVLGSACNAELICTMWTNSLQGSAERAIHIGSPAVCLTKRERKEPQIVLGKLDELIGPAPSTGGFHRMTNHDFTIYSLVHQVVRRGWQPNEHARRLLPYHPAYPALSFIPTLSEDAACRLLARIVDPRWFVNPGRPNRLQRLYNYLGLVEVNFIRHGGYHADRAEMTAQAWSGLNRSHRNSGYAVMHPEAPGNFLYRVIEKYDGDDRGWYLATRKFLQFVRAVWMDELADTGGRFDGWFVPDYFFRSREEVTAFKRHREGVKRPV